MNEHTEDLLKKLEDATSHEPLAHAADDETATLRESWTVLSRLLESADAELEEVVPELKPKSPSTNWVGFAAAIVAALVVAFVSWSVVKQAIWSPDSSEEISATNNRAVGDSEVAATNTSNDSESQSLFAWEDSLDEDLAQASIAIRSARTDWNSGQAGYSSLSKRFAQFEEELDAGSL